jgi:hypothetical protein
MTAPFWRTKSLEAMNREEWESLCDGCGLCCLVKLEDADSGAIAFTRAACQLLDSDSCRCRDYRNRSSRVPDCVPLTPATLGEIPWLPRTCAYRLLHEGKPLRDWHPLVSGDPESVHRAGISVRGRVISELDVAEDDLEEQIVHWVD